MGSAYVSWLSPSEIVRRGFETSPVVMMNEAHNGMARCPRTRRVGKEVLPAAHAAGCRHLAMEAIYKERAGPIFLTDPPQEIGYLAQPEMRELVDEALKLGWTLVGYEISGEEMHSTGRELLSIEATNHRELVQAQNLVAVHRQIGGLPMMVWCGNSHHAKGVAGDWTPMGVRFMETAGFEPYSIDQTQTIAFGEWALPNVQLTDELRRVLDAHGGTVGFTSDDPPQRFEIAGVFDAFILSTDNEMIGGVDPPANGVRRRDASADPDAD